MNALALMASGCDKKERNRLYNMKNYRLYFIRHGITQGNLEGKYVGSTDLPLCEQGRKELLDLKEKAEYPQVQVVYASPLQRCLQTAEILYPDTLLIPSPNLREYDFGNFENHSMEELKKNEAFVRWLEGAMVKAPEGGEDKQAFDERISIGLGEIIKDMMNRSVTDAAVITHGGVIMGLLSMYGLPKRNPLAWTVDNGHGYTAVTSSYLWGQGQLLEVMDPIPYREEDSEYPRDYDLIDIPEQEDEE